MLDLTMMKESCRLVVMGSGGVGKSSLVMQYLQGKYSADYQPTVEDCYSHTLRLPNGKFHALEILDTAGSHHFPAMRELSIRCGRAFVIVFAVNNQQTFFEAQALWDLIKKIKGDNRVPVVLVGNKIDLSSERDISWQTATDYVADNIENGSYLETSAKYNLYINEIFNELLLLAFEHPKEPEPMSRLSLSVSEMSFASLRRKSREKLGSKKSPLVAPSPKPTGGTFFYRRQTSLKTLVAVVSPLNSPKKSTKSVAKANDKCNIL